MFTGFNLKTKKTYEEYYEHGEVMYENLKQKVENKLDEYVGKDGSIDGSRLQEDWFPQIKANIFISHSHKDEKLAIGLAGWLNKNFGLISFIDSCIWGYSNELLRKIDEIYCTSGSGQSNFSYEKRNFSTSHVHMMLATALTSMIDKTECVIFLNTNNSTTTTKQIIDNETYSPWIYSEIVTTRLINKKELPDERKNEISKSIELSEQYSYNNLSVKYDLDLTHLYKLSDKDLIKLENMKSNNMGVKALDNLYSIIGVEI